MPGEEVLASNLKWFNVAGALACLPYLLAAILMLSAGILHVRRRPRWPGGLIVAGGGLLVAGILIGSVSQVLRAAGIDIYRCIWIFHQHFLVVGTILFSAGFVAHARLHGNDAPTDGPEARERLAEKSEPGA
ncbi:MAG: hypothetical protein ACYS9X_24290 [Planctomycetota bacterium]|jgi:hypothetical protein